MAPAAGLVLAGEQAGPGRLAGSDRGRWSGCPGRLSGPLVPGIEGAQAACILLRSCAGSSSTFSHRGLSMKARSPCCRASSVAGWPHHFSGLWWRWRQTQVAGDVFKRDGDGGPSRHEGVAGRIPVEGELPEREFSVSFLRSPRRPGWKRPSGKKSRRRSSVDGHRTARCRSRGHAHRDRPL